VALDLAIAGILFEGRALTGSYRYADAELDPEGEASFRWLRDGAAIPGEVGPSHVVTTADYGRTLAFEVTPRALWAWPPETLAGNPARVTSFVPVPAYPRGTGGPGGVGVADGRSDLRAWLRAAEGVLTSGSDVTDWRDQSGYGRDAFTIETSRRPDLVSGVGPLASLAVRFDGASHLLLPRPVEDSLTLVAVFATTSTTYNGSWWLSPAILGGETPPPCSADYHLGTNGGKPMVVVQDATLTTGSLFSDGAPHAVMATRVMSTGRLRLYVDGVQHGSIVAGTASLTCPTYLYVGSSTAVDGWWTGDLLELCAYDHVLVEVERNLIGTYFAARFGVADPIGLFAFAATHGGDVAGIGRDTTGNSVEAAEGPGILRVSAPSALSDGDYLAWGTDRPADFSLATDVPPPFERRLARTWAYTVTDGGALDGVGTVDLRFRVGGLYLTTDPDDFALLLDADGNFADAAVHPARGEYDEELGTIEFREVELAPQRFIGLAVRPL
jgi:hypothetical protein